MFLHQSIIKKKNQTRTYKQKSGDNHDRQAPVTALDTK